MQKGDSMGKEISMECKIAKGIKHEIVSTIPEEKHQYFSSGVWGNISMEAEKPDQ
jgi:hypothetical protein